MLSNLFHSNSMPWCEKSKTYQVQKLEKAHLSSLSNGRRFEARYAKKAEVVNSLLSYIYKESKGNRKSVTPCSSWFSVNSTTSLLRRNKNK